MVPNKPGGYLVEVMSEAELPLGFSKALDHVPRGFCHELIVDRLTRSIAIKPGNSCEHAKQIEVVTRY